VDPWIYVLAITIVPWIELRGAIPVGILQYGLDPVKVFLAATFMNVMIILPLFIFLDWFFHIIEKIPLFDRIISRIQRKAGPYVEKYGEVGLALFVGMPLPGTGAYSGSLAAHILGIKNRRAYIGIASGVVIAGVIITLASTILYESLGFLLNTL